LHQIKERLQRLEGSSNTSSLKSFLTHTVNQSIGKFKVNLIKSCYKKLRFLGSKNRVSSFLAGLAQHVNENNH